MSGSELGSGLSWGCRMTRGCPDKVRYPEARPGRGKPRTTRKYRWHSHPTKKGQQVFNLLAFGLSGALERIRTSGTWIRNPALYPTELRGLYKLLTVNDGYKRIALI